MSQAGRVGDVAQCSNDEHEEDGGHSVEGEALLGSPDVIINGRAALRDGDSGVHSGCAGPNTWQAFGGSRAVFINGKPAFRYGDDTQHCGGKGELVEGSPDVFIGDGKPGTPKERPHDKTVTIDVTDALGRPLHDVQVSVFCPHEQRETKEIQGSTSIDGLCSGATVTVHKPLQAGAWDANASAKATSSPQLHQQPSSSGAKAVVQAPAPSGTAPDQHSISLPRPSGGTEVVIPTVHNWVELIYRAFGHHVPTGPKELALLGVREASLAAAVPGQPTPIDTLEKEAGAGDLEDVSFTRERRAPTYNDLLFCVWTDKTVHHRQHVEVFECTIDAHPGTGTLHLPFLVEGKMFHARPGPYKKAYPGKNVTLHVFHGMHEHKKPAGTTAEHLLAVAMKERGTTESPAGSNRTKYGAWYGDNGVFWCAQFVSWCFAHAGMPQIHYEGCILGADQFQKGVWGTWHGSGSRAEPGDIVFYNFPGEAVYDHTGIVLKDNGSSITTIEGNTSAPGGSGSQSNGGGVFMRTRDKDGTIIGYGRPRFSKPHHEPGSFIRWGGEGTRLHGKAMHGSTLLHHHYWKKDAHGHNHPDPAAARYKRFMQLYNGAKNKAHIPYLIVSSKYIKTYSEWVTWAQVNGVVKPGRKSVIRESGLRSPGGHAHHYVPSFISKEYADRVLERTRHMHDHHKAERLRDAILGCLMKLST